VEQTVVSEESGGENKVEITLTDGQKTEVVIRNGKDGKDGEGGGEGGNVTPESIGAVKKSGDTMTGQLSLPSLRVTGYGTPLEMGKYLDMHNPNSPDDDFSVRLIADGDTLKMQRKGVGAYDTFYHTGNKPTAADVGAFGQLKAWTGTDLNDFKSFGAVLVTTSQANRPTNTAPYATVWNISGNGSAYLIQNYLDVVSMRHYYRGFIDGAWKDWKQIATTDYIDEQILKGEW
jgi:hypothetical protein